MAVRFASGKLLALVMLDKQAMSNPQETRSKAVAESDRIMGALSDILERIGRNRDRDGWRQPHDQAALVVWALRDAGFRIAARELA